MSESIWLATSMLRGWWCEAVGWLLVSASGVSGAAVRGGVVGVGGAGAWDASAARCRSGCGGVASDVRFQPESVGGVGVTCDMGGGSKALMKSGPVTYAVIETPDGVTRVNAQYFECRWGMFMVVPSAGVRRELAALALVLISIGLALPEDLTDQELACVNVLRTRPRQATLHLMPWETQAMRVKWLSDQDVLTAADAVAELEGLAAAHA